MEEGREEGGFLVESELLVVKKVQKMSVDLVECCGGKKSLEGELPLARLTKLLPILRRREDGSPPAGWLRYELRGERDAAGRNFVHLRLSATLPMICQRCTGALEWKLNGRRQFLLQDGRASLSAAERQEVEELDATEVDWADFLAEEVLLSLPMAPMHPFSECPVRHRPEWLANEHFMKKGSPYGCSAK